MTRKEYLVFEMENLSGMIKDYLQVLDKREIDEMAYQRLDEEMYSVLWALRYYFGEDPFANKQIIMLEP